MSEIMEGVSIFGVENFKVENEIQKFFFINLEFFKNVEIIENLKNYDNLFSLIYF